MPGGRGAIIHAHVLDANYHIYLAIIQGFPLSRMTTNN